MKKLIRPAIVIGMSLTLALTCAAVTTYSAKITGLGHTTSSAAMLLQPPPATPQSKQGKSEVGSTDGIVVMGGVIALIVLVPILVQRKSWMRTE